MYLNKNILKNIYTLSSAQALLLVIPIILISILLRTVGLEGFGYYSLAQGFSALVFIIVEAGNDIFFTSRLANDEKKLTDSQNSYISAAYIVKIATSVLILVLLLLILNLWSNSVADYKVLWISAWILGFTQGFSLNWLFHAKKMFLLPALVDVLAKLMAIGACILFFVGELLGVSIDSSERGFQMKILRGFVFMGYFNHSGYDMRTAMGHCNLAITLAAIGAMVTTFNTHEGTLRIEFPVVCNS